MTTGRRRRIHIPNTFHHVMVRGNNRQHIFFDSRCFKKIIDIVGESVKKFDHEILCYCFMTNHAHFLIHVHDDKLSCVMKYINYRYARWLNYTYKKIGHVFQDRYRSIEVGNETYLVNLCRYIHYNPLSAHIVDELNDYRWSSHQYYINQNPPEWLQTNWVLSVIKNKTKMDYVDFIYQPADRESWKPAMRVSDDGNIIFDEDAIRQFHLEQNLQVTLKRKTLSETVVAEIVCRHLEINYQMLTSSSRERYLSKPRIILANFWMIYANLGVVEIAKRFQRTHSIVSRQLAQFRKEKHCQSQAVFLEKIHSEINTLL